MADAYLTLGVSSTKEEIHRAVEKLDRGIFSNAFCKLIEDPCGDPDWCAAMHADGAGTKASLAYLKFCETGDYTPFFEIAQDSIVMNLDDLLCVGAVDGFVMSNTIDRNAHRIDGKAVSAVIDGYQSFIESMKQFGINILMCGGETADVGDLASTLIVNSTFFVRLPKKDVVDCANIKSGQVIVGFSSSGKAIYEKKYNAGMGSNGLTAARHLLLSKYYAEKYPESYSDTIDYDKVYRGKFMLEDILPGSEMFIGGGVSIGDAMLSPTRTYAPVIRELLSSCREGIGGIIHCTGGGQVKCRNFGVGVRYIKDNLIEIPPLFRTIFENSDITPKEMYQTFNMGQRLEVFCDPYIASNVIAVADKYGIEAKITGRIEASVSGRNEVVINDKLTDSVFEY